MKGTSMTSTITITVRTDEPRRVLACQPNARHGGRVEWVAPEGTAHERCPMCGRTVR
jgi:hypothetical protein